MIRTARTTHDDRQKILKLARYGWTAKEITVVLPWSYGTVRRVMSEGMKSGALPGKRGRRRIGGVL